MKKKKYIISLDIGTTSTKGLLFEIGGEIIDDQSKSYPVYYPDKSMVEQDPDEVLNAVVKVVNTLIVANRIEPESIDAVVFGGILHSIIPVDKDGSPLNRALIWADSRSTEQSEELRKDLDNEEVRLRTGCTIHPLYFLPRLLWFKKNAKALLKKIHKFISIKEYVLSRLYGIYLVDKSIASGTGIWRMATMDWDDELLSSIGMKRNQFSQIAEPTQILKGLNKTFASEMGLLQGTPGIIGASDGPLAHLGSTGLNEKAMSLTIGTSGALRRRLITPKIIPGMEAWCYYLAENNWILGAVTHDAGIVMKWFFDHFIRGKTETEENFNIINAFADDAPAGADGLFFFPFLGGERSPHYNPLARGAIIGMSFNHEQKHLVRALMEGISYRLYSNYKMLDPQKEMELVVTGGIRKSPVWMQITADYFGKKLLIPSVKEAAAWGGVLLGLRVIGIIDSLEKTDQYTRYAGHIDYNTKNHTQYQYIDQLYNDLYSRLFVDQ